MADEKSEPILPPEGVGMTVDELNECGEEKIKDDAKYQRIRAASYAKQRDNLWRSLLHAAAQVFGSDLLARADGVMDGPPMSWSYKSDVWEFHLRPYGAAVIECVFALKGVEEGQRVWRIKPYRDDEPASLFRVMQTYECQDVGELAESFKAKATDCTYVGHVGEAVWLCQQQTDGYLRAKAKAERGVQDTPPKA